MTDGLRPGEEVVSLPGPYDAGLWFIGRIHTPWPRREDCPRRGDDQAGPDCILEVDPRWERALAGLEAKDHIQVLYWMDQARRDAVLQSRHGAEAPVGTFALRSPVRPNPIASSVVRLIRIDGHKVHVRGLDCVDGTPLLDIKPAVSRPDLG